MTTGTDQGVLELPPRIVLVRHASTEWSRSGRHTGRTDIPLDAAGREATRELAPRFQTVPDPLVLSSPLSRAVETCELSGFGVPELVDALLEWDYGTYEGLTTAAIRRDRPGWNLFIDGCPGGEDAAAVGARADTVIERLTEPSLHPTVVVFAHGHLLRVLAARWLELDPAQGSRFFLHAGRVSELGYEREVRVLKGWNG